MAEDLAGHEEVSQVGTRKALAGVAIAAGVRWAAVLDELVVAKVDPSAVRQDRSVSSNPRGQDAVEHVDAAGNRLDQVAGRTHTHQVAWAIAGQDRRLQGEQPIGDRLRLPQAQPADAEAVERLSGENLGALPAKVIIEPALDDPETQLAGSGLGREASGRPSVRAVHRGTSRFSGCGPGDRLVARHHDIRYELPLARHDRIRRATLLAAVEARGDDCAISAVH